MRTPSRLKRRTPQHVLADLSVNYLERFVLNCGWVMEEFHRDYGIDAHIRTFTDSGAVESGTVLVQIKARSLPRETGDGAFVLIDVDARDARDWIASLSPVILVVFDGATRTSYWCHMQPSLPPAPAIETRRSIRVRVPKVQVIDESAVIHFRRLRDEAYNQSPWEGSTASGTFRSKKSPAS